jgi:hypothetical protein
VLGVQLPATACCEACFLGGATPGVRQSSLFRNIDKILASRLAPGGRICRILSRLRRRARELDSKFRQETGGIGAVSILGPNCKVEGLRWTLCSSLYRARVPVLPRGGTDTLVKRPVAADAVTASSFWF